MYVELKSGYADNGPAWIANIAFSKSGQTIYFDGKALRSSKGCGIGSNYHDVKTGEEYWVSGIKKNEQNRHWAGGGIVEIDKECVAGYLEAIGKRTLSKGIKVVNLQPSAPTMESHKYENQKLGTNDEKPVPGRRTSNKKWDHVDLNDE